ncbi:MAG TPA: phosphotransferase, partial [Propionibacteriaceae bacterium]|nr:phosphotransferase [Propionibacteriaceae bacterium]
MTPDWPQAADWPDAAWLRSWWPLPAPLDAAELGSGLRIVDADGRAWHLKRREPGRLVGELFVLAQLATAGVPVTLPATTRDGLLEVERDGLAYWLYPEIEGTPLAQRPALADGATRVTWRRLGEAAADLQRQLRRIDPDEARLNGVPVRHESVAPAPIGVQVIHGDMHAGNVLFVEGRVSGYLDFDHLTLGPRLVDPCYASGALLARLMEVGGEVEQRWLELTGELFRGWCASWAASGQAVSDEELDAVPATFVEIEADFRAWLVDTGDTDGVALTDAMVEVVRRRADDLVA